MRVCAHDPNQPEFSLCGESFDLKETVDDDEVEAYELATESGRNVTCFKCIATLKELFTYYTPSGRLK